MKKTLLVISIFSLWIGISSAQNVRFYSTRNELLPQNAEYTVSNAVGIDFVQAHFKVKNEGSAPISVKVRKQELQIHGTSTCSFCWVSCYPPNVTESEFAMTIPAGGFGESTLDADFSPDVNNPGASRIAFTAFNVANPNDTARVIMIFDMYTGLENNSAKTVRIYPNPVADRLFIDNLNGGKVEIFNTVGQ
ncbi:MAG TPA: hypothetical protein PK990_02895, partial [Salinivirgaceae bacterium]|nr:hypothetical protein [Salinivirgaceae bacterium]